MKSSRTETHSRVHKVPEVRYGDHRMTAFSGLVIFQLLFKRLDLKAQLRRCFGKVDAERSYGLATIVLQLVIHALLGFRRMRDSEYYAKDPLVLRILGVPQLPNVSTISRTLAGATTKCFEALRRLLRQLVLDRLRTLALATVTLDFDGTVLSTRRHAEGSAVGYNKRRKGDRSYYPLLCTISQTGQVLDLHHRPGNVHDSRDAIAFITEKIADVRGVVPHARIESRLDSAFFSEATLDRLEELSVEYAVSVPFERFPELKRRIERRTSGWQRIDDVWSAIELDWGADSWSSTRRLIAVRKRVPVRRKGPLQLDLFEPREHGYEFKVIVTNKSTTAKTVLHFHNGRGNQEGTIGETKHWAGFDYVPCRTLIANQLFSCASLLAHNLSREVQMATQDPRATRPLSTRAAMFDFLTLGVFRRRFLLRAGYITRPAGRQTLTVSATDDTREGFEHYMNELQRAA